VRTPPDGQGRRAPPPVPRRWGPAGLQPGPALPQPGARGFAGRLHEPPASCVVKDQRLCRAWGSGCLSGYRGQRPSPAGGGPHGSVFRKVGVVSSSLQYHRALWAATGLLALAAALWGVADPGIYSGVVTPDLIPGAYSQDLISVAASIALIFLAVSAGPGRARSHILALGLLGYLFYAYGIYVIERTYNGLYLVYMAIFALAFWTLTAAATGLRQDPRVPSLPRALRIVSASGALLQPLIFYPLWIAMLLPLMGSRNQIDSLYSVFILDLCFIMPAFLLLAVLTFRSRPLGLLLLPALYVLGFTLIFSLALGELVKPLFAAETNFQALWLSLALSTFFAILGSLHLRKLEIPAQPLDTNRRSATQRPLDARTGH
jgi:hypothetical protein